MILHTIAELTKGTVLHRPSKVCKTPYVADVETKSKTNILAHSPSLGCCGLADKESTVLLSNTNGGKCTMRIDLSIQTDSQFPDKQTIVGINPKLGETIAENALKGGCIHDLKNIKSYEREKTFLNSRFDFWGIDENDREFIMEVKSVPLADYVDVAKKDRHKYADEISSKQYHQKIAYFPDGYRKNQKDAVSPRALKHIQELEEIVTTTDKRVILCFIVQRGDATAFTTSVIDPIYKKAVRKAFKAGVEIKTIQVQWDADGNCHFVRNNLTIIL